MNIKTKGFFISAFFFIFAFSIVSTGKIFAEEPFITVAEPINGTLFEIQSDVTLKGNTLPNSEVVLTTKDGEYAKLTSGGDGSWSYTIPTVTEGSHTIVATVKVPIDSLSTKTASANVTYVVGTTSSGSASSLAETGILLFIAIPAGLLLITLTLYTYIDYRRHKRPLKAADPRVNYSFWHHIHMVSLPLLRYRLSINLDRRLPNQSDKIRRY